MGEPVTLMAGFEPAPAPEDISDGAELIAKSGVEEGKVQSLSDLIAVVLWGPRREAGERSAECPEMRCTPPNIDWAEPGDELGRAMDAPDQASESEIPDGETAERLLTENSEEERGEKPKEEADAEESAALGRSPTVPA